MASDGESAVRDFIVDVSNQAWLIFRTKRAIGMSPFQLVYGAEVRFPSSLGFPVMKLLQEQEDDPNNM